MKNLLLLCDNTALIRNESLLTLYLFSSLEYLDILKF